MVSLTTKRGEPCATSTRNRWCDGNGLDVGNGRGATEKSDIGGERRLQSGLTLLALDGFDQSGLFTTDVGTGASVQVDVKVVAGSAGILSDETGGIGLVDGLLNVRCFLVEFTSNVDVGCKESESQKVNRQCRNAYLPWRSLLDRPPNNPRPTCAGHLA